MILLYALLYFFCICKPNNISEGKTSFCDSETETWNMDPILLDKAIKACIKKGNKPKAIILVHLYGFPAKLNEIMEISNKYDIPVIEDAAEAIGSKYNDQPLGTFGEIGIFSFNGNKIITTSSGGAIISKNKNYIEKAKFLSTQARDNFPHYEHSEIGYNYRMSNVCAAIGIGQIEILESRVEREEDIFIIIIEKIYHPFLLFLLLRILKGFYSNRWLTTILISNKSEINREDIRLELLKNNIESRPLWKPMHLQPVFNSYDLFNNGVSEDFFDRGLCLPSGSNMDEKDLQRVVNVIKVYMKTNFINLSRYYKQILMILSDQLVVLFALSLAFVLRFGDFNQPLHYMQTNWWLFLLLIVITTFFFIRSGLYRAVLKYIGFKLIIQIFRATTLSCLFVILFLFFYDPNQFPRSILLTFWFISNVLLVISRFLFKGILYSWDSFKLDRKNILIYGAGKAGAQISESLKKTNDYNVVGFIDDDKSKISTIVNSIEVFGFDEINNLIENKSVKSLILAIPSARTNQRQEILKKLSRYPLEVKSLPNLDDIENDLVTLEQIKFVEVDDILGREIVLPKELLRKNIYDKNILITGAGGSIGSELSRQIKNLQPSKIILLDNSEYNLYNIHHELTITNGVEVIPVLSTVTKL